MYHWRNIDIPENVMGMGYVMRMVDAEQHDALPGY
jgi:hypothetical protein